MAFQNRKQKKFERETLRCPFLPHPPGPTSTALKNALHKPEKPIFCRLPVLFSYLIIVSYYIPAVCFWCCFFLSVCLSCALVFYSRCLWFASVVASILAVCLLSVFASFVCCLFLQIDTGKFFEKSCIFLLKKICRFNFFYYICIEK